MSKSSSSVSDLKDALYNTAVSLQKAFPSYKHLSVGQLTFGLVCVAVIHHQTHQLDKIHKNPLLYIDRQSNEENLQKISKHSYIYDCEIKDEETIEEDTSDEKQSKIRDYYRSIPNVKRFNPENVSDEILITCKQSLQFANIVYLPTIYHNFGKNRYCYEKNEENAPFSEHFDKYTIKMLMQIEAEKKNGIDATMSHLMRCELIYSVDISKHLQNAFVILLDRIKKKVIISIRGTNSLHDIFTDFTAHTSVFKCFKYYDDSPDLKKKNNFVLKSDILRNTEKVTGMVHDGVLNCAKWTFAKIRKRIVKTLARYPDFDIFLTGHSLGGGIACLISILLRDQFKNGMFQKDINESRKEQGMEAFPNDNILLPKIDSIAFSPTATFSYDLSVWSSKFITSFVVGSDLVPRFSAGQCEDLRLEILNSNWETKLDKVKSDVYVKYSEYVQKVSSYVSSIPVIGTLARSKSGKNLSSTESTKTVILETTITEEKKVVIEDESSKVVLKEKVEVMKKRNDSIETLYPCGNIYLFIEDEEYRHDVHTNSTIQEQIKKKLKFKEEVKTSYSYTDLVQYGVSYFMDKYLSEDPNIEEEDTKVPDLECPKIKTKTFSKMRKFEIRHVDPRHFDRIIISKRMIEDHKLENYFDALNFLLYMEQQFNTFNYKYIPSKIN